MSGAKRSPTPLSPVAAAAAALKRARASPRTAPSSPTRPRSVVDPALPSRARFVFFWRPSESHGWLSNWSPHAVREAGVLFPTAEHYLMYHKAKAMGDEEAASATLRAESPKQAKAIGRRVARFDERRWEALREAIMVRGLTLKIGQHPMLRSALLSTREKVIVEASPYDSVWGIGCSEDDARALDETRWPGTNLLGKAWMRVREVAS